MKLINEKNFYKILIVCLVFLFNPNFSTVDILPDFVAYFLLARLFLRAADAAAYFEEARAAFIKLGWLSILKLPAFLLTQLIRQKNANDNDIVALVSLVFAVMEIIFLVSAIRNIFEALFHLGERSDARALIAPFKLSKDASKTITPETLRAYTFFFAICKCILYTLPDMLLLTSFEVDPTAAINPFRFYPLMLILSAIFGFIVGGVWLSRMIKYAKAVNDEGKFFSALSYVYSDSSEKNTEKSSLRSMLFTITLMATASILSADLVFGDFRGIDLLPQFIFAIFATFAFYSLSKYTKTSRTPLFITGGVYTLVSILNYIFTFRFLNKFQYSDLMTTKEALATYIPVEIFSILEFISLVAFLVVITRILISFIIEHTGLSPLSERYGITERRYHAVQKKKAYTFMILGILMGATRLANVFLNRDVQILYAFVDDFDKRPISASSVPWFGLVVAVSSIFFIAYSLYYFSSLKEEVKLKYEYQ